MNGTRGMSLMSEPRVYSIGDFAGFVDLAARGPVEVPLPTCWYVLRTHPNKEASVMAAFRRRNISFYCPMIARMQIVQRRRHGFASSFRRKVSVPMFPGIIFVPDCEAGDPRIRDVDGIIGYLQFGTWHARLTPDQLADVRHIEAASNVPISKRKRAYAIGQLVRVVDGPFASFTGRIERLDSHGRLSILLDIFKRLTPMEVDEGQIEPEAATDRRRHGSTAAGFAVARHRNRRRFR